MNSWSISSWQKRAGRILEGIVSTGRVANAYLFVGPPLSGKTTAAREFFCALNGLPPGTHNVNYYELKPAAAVITLEQVHELQRFVQYGPREQKYLVAVVQNAEKLASGQAVAANAFLKILEEPPAGVVFILETFSKEALLATLASRCQVINFDQLPAAALRDILGAAAYTPEIAALSGGLPHFAALLQEQLPRFQTLVEFVQQIKTKNFAQIAQYVEELSRDKELWQNYLLLLAQYFRNQQDAARANLVLKYVKILRGNVNIKLTLEVLLLRMRDL